MITIKTLTDLVRHADTLDHALNGVNEPAVARALGEAAKDAATRKLVMGALDGLRQAAKTIREAEVVVDAEHEKTRQKLSALRSLVLRVAISAQEE